MDAVITYVDGRDPVWQESYRSALNVPAVAKRYRDWGTLRFLLRGIEAYMPFVRKVHLVVSSDSQVPEWVNRDEVHVVLHGDIIPASCLPTFNSCTIEMFLHRIPGLDERFLYFNDDMFPVAACDETDFFMDGKACIGFSWCLIADGLYKKQTRNSDRLARRMLGFGSMPWFIRPQHTVSPMLRQWSEDLFTQAEGAVMASLSRTREARNLNQYLYLDYLYYGGQAVSRRLDNKHISLATRSGSQVRAWLLHPSHRLVCINDVHLSEEQFAAYREDILAGFAERLPHLSRFEHELPH